MLIQSSIISYDLQHYLAYPYVIWSLGPEFFSLSGAGHQLLLKRCFKLEERSTGWEWAVLPCWQAENPQIFHFLGVCLLCKATLSASSSDNLPCAVPYFMSSLALCRGTIYTSFTTTFTIQLPNYKSRTRI